MAMLKNKQITFSLILVCLIVVSPMANAQLGLGLGGLLGGLLLGGTSGGLLGGGLLNVANIQGVLYCSINGALSGASTPAFANAGVELQCGKANTVVSKTTTNTAGLFSIPSDNINMLLSTLLSDCKLVVTTPLATCNVSLSAPGNLVSQLTVVGSTVSGLINIVDIVPSGFNLVQLI